MYTFQRSHTHTQGYNSRKVNCSCVYSAYILKPVCKQEYMHQCFVSYPWRIKVINFDNSHNNFLWLEYFINFLCERWIPCQPVTSVLCLHYRDSTLQYKRCVHLGHNFPCIITMHKRIFWMYSLKSCVFVVFREIMQ